MFPNVEVCWPDAGIWKNSAIRLSLLSTDNAVLLEDGGYGIEPLLMTPYGNHNSHNERKYNKLL